MKRKFLYFIITLFVSLYSTVSSVRAAEGVILDKKIIKIGLLGPLTGSFQKIGECFADGMKAYLEQLNAKGGMGGFKFELIAYDNNNDPILIKNVIEKIVKKDKVFAVVGCIGGINVNIIIKELINHGIPVIHPVGGDYDWVVRPKRNIFTVQPDYFTEGYLMVKFALLNLKAKRIAFVCNDDGVIGTSYLKGADKAMEEIGKKLGASVVLKMARNPLSIRLEVAIKKLKEVKPDVTILADFLINVAGVINGANRSGIQTKWVTSCINGDDIMYKMCGKAWLGVYVSGWIKRAGDNFENFINYFNSTDYHRKALANYWRSPSGFHASGWIACEIFFGGLKIFYRKYKNMELLDREKFIESMEKMRNFNDTLAKDITYLPLAVTEEGASDYYRTRRGQSSMYFSVASLSPKKEFYLKQISDWLTMD